LRVLLINPPKSPKNLIAEYAPPDMKRELNRIGLIGPPLSLNSLAGNLPEFDVDIFDLKAEYDLGLVLNLDDAVCRKLEEFRPDIVGITFLTSDYNQGIRILKLCKQFNRRILTIVGGVHVSLCPADFDLPCVDICIFGPGKKIFRDIVIEHEKGSSFRNIPNISVLSEGCHRFTKRENMFLKPENLLSNVYSNRKLTKKYDDAYRAGKNRKAIAFVETSYGCPNKCTFCSIWPVNGGGFYKRNIDDVIGELRTMTDYEAIRLIDANTMGDIDYSNRLFDRIIEEKLNKVFIMDIRSDTAAKHPELISKAAEAGLRVAIVGFESINDNELEYYNKESSSDIVLKSIEVFRKNNIDIRGVCIVQPDYDEKDFEVLESFLDNNGLMHSAISIMTPFPGTPLYEEVKHKIIINDLDYYNLFNSVFETKLPYNEFYGRISEIYRGKRGMQNFAG